MTRRGFVGAIMGGLIACGGHAQPAAVAPAPAAQLTCEQVAPSVDVLVRQSGPSDAAHRARVGPFVKAMKAQVVQSCSADGWSMALRECLVGAHSHADFEGCERLFTPEQQRHFEVATEQIVAATLPDETPPAPVEVAVGSTGIPACDDYLAGLERYLACDKVPEQARAAMRDSIDQLRQTWRGLSDASMPEEARRAASDACKQASDAIGQSASAMGCAP